MYFTRFLVTPLTVCCLLVAMATAKPTTSDTVDKLNKQLMQPVKKYLRDELLVAASTGKNLYKLKDKVSDNCTRTAAVVVRLVTQPSTFVVANPLVEAASNRVPWYVAKYLPENAMESFCQFLNEEFTKNVSHFDNFEQLRNNVSLGEISHIVGESGKNYYLESMSDSDLEVLNSTAFLKVEAAYKFLNWADSNVSDSVISGAIQRLSYDIRFRSAVDRAFDKLIDEYVADLQSRFNDYPSKSAEIRTHSQSNKMDEYFVNSAWKREYELYKKEAEDM